MLDDVNLYSTRMRTATLAKKLTPPPPFPAKKSLPKLVHVLICIFVFRVIFLAGFLCFQCESLLCNNSLNKKQDSILTTNLRQDFKNLQNINYQSIPIYSDNDNTDNALLLSCLARLFPAVTDHHNRPSKLSLLITVEWDALFLSLRYSILEWKKRCCYSRAKR